MTQKKATNWVWESGHVTLSLALPSQGLRDLGQSRVREPPCLICDVELSGPPEKNAGEGNTYIMLASR